MFKDCSSLGDLSKFTLKAEYPPGSDIETESDVHCYQGMFYNSGVTKAPVIMLKNHQYGYDYYITNGTLHLTFAQCKNIEEAYFPNMSYSQVSILNNKGIETFAASNTVTVYFDNNKESIWFND
jgi:hypothetical protein